ncbi:MAG: ACP S-malonyltransferase [Candidatus Hodarchaeota archaeon]
MSRYLIQPRPQLQTQPVALLIPGIGIPYSISIERLRDNPVFRANCARAGIDDFRNAELDRLKKYDHFVRDNLNNQKLSYVVNCAMCDLYQRRGIIPQLVVGYSMGIYSALYTAGYYSFETGLSIVEKAYYLIEEYCSLKPRKYRMALILGLTENNIRDLLFKEVGEGVNIAVYNGKRSFVIAGEREKVDFCSTKALELGAFGVKPILTEHPYHTAFLKDIKKLFSQFLNALSYSVPVSHVLSLIDAKVIAKDEVINVIVRMIYTPLHFDAVVDTLVRDHNISICYETGPAQSMKKLVRYINRRVKVHSFEEEEVQ